MFGELKASPSASRGGRQAFCPPPPGRPLTSEHSRRKREARSQAGVYQALRSEEEFGFFPKMINILVRSTLHLVALQSTFIYGFT